MAPSPPAVGLYVDFVVRGFVADPQSSVPVLVLQDLGERFFLPIWIGLPEATAIAAHLGGQPTPRPMTHDLIRLILERLGGVVTRVDVRAIEEGVFLADLWIRDGAGGDHRIDCRPSDAIALAVRVDAPIRVAAAVLEAAHPAHLDEATVPPAGLPAVLTAVPVDDAAACALLLKTLAEMDPADFGKYRA